MAQAPAAETLAELLRLVGEGRPLDYFAGPTMEALYGQALTLALVQGRLKLDGELIVPASCG